MVSFSHSHRAQRAFAMNTKPEKPVSDAHGWAFRSDLDVDRALARVQGAEGCTFLVRDSEYDGLYVNGTHDNGTRIRILAADKTISDLEIAFPGPAKGGPLSAEQRKKFLEEVIPDLLRRLSARDVKVKA